MRIRFDDKITLFIVMIILITQSWMLAGCGGKPDASQTVLKENLRAQRAVTITELPDLFVCLQQIDTALQKNPRQAGVGINCATGTYRGLTPEGRDCAMQIDGDAGTFTLQVESEVFRIQWENVAFAADGSAIHNLEDASVPGQPGIQLTRFTGAQIPLTEALIFRAGKGVPALPQMIYQRNERDANKFVRCSFGK